MHDPLEGVTRLGTIETGARKDRISGLFKPVLDAAVSATLAADVNASLYVYGSVATGMARAPISDVDLLTVGLPSDKADAIGRTLSVRFSDLCRGVQVAAAQPSDFSGEADEAYGGRVFLRHYCVHLAGPDLHSGLSEFAADIRAARGFNGDIARHSRRWRRQLEAEGDPVQLGRRLARKTLLAVAGLVSVHDNIWTTDRATAVARWAKVEPTLADDLQMLLSWSRDLATPNRAAVEAALDGVVTQIIASFESSIGLWTSKTSTNPHPGSSQSHPSNLNGGDIHSKGQESFGAIAEPTARKHRRRRKTP